jgi:ABC-type phosphate transport system ATPase subunit
MSSVDVRKLNVWFKNNHVLKEVSFTIREKAVTAIMGPLDVEKPRSYRRSIE